MDRPLKPTPPHGTYRTHTPAPLSIDVELEPLVMFDDDTPSHTSPALLMYQQVHRIFDELTPAQRQQFVMIAEAYTKLSPNEQAFVTAAIEKLAGL